MPPQSPMPDANEPPVDSASPCVPTAAAPEQQTAGAKAPSPNRLLELIERFGYGDLEAGHVLYVKYQDSLYALLRWHLNKHMPLRDVYETPDLSQETWIAILEQIREGKRFANEAGFRSFMSVIARNVVRKANRTHITTEKRSLTREVRLDVTVHDTSSSAPSPEELMAAHEAWERLFARAPSPRAQEVLMGLRYGEDLAHLAQRTGFPLRGLQRMMASMRKRLAQENARE